MKKPKSLDDIEKLYDTEAQVIDVLPMMMADRKYNQIEKVLSRKKLKDYADKISTIMVLLWGYYDLEIYLTRFPAKASRYRYSDLVYKDIADIGFKKLYGIIEYVIMENVSSVQVYAPLNHFVISIRGGFNTCVYNLNARDLEFVQSLVEHEGLYMYSRSSEAVSLSAPLPDFDEASSDAADTLPDEDPREREKAETGPEADGSTADAGKITGAKRASKADGSAADAEMASETLGPETEDSAADAQVAADEKMAAEVPGPEADGSAADAKPAARVPEPETEGRTAKAEMPAEAQGPGTNGSAADVRKTAETAGADRPAKKNRKSKNAKRSRHSGRRKK